MGRQWRGARLGTLRPNSSDLVVKAADNALSAYGTQHNREVFSGLVGLSENEYRRLAQEGIIVRRAQFRGRQATKDPLKGLAGIENCSWRDLGECCPIV